MLYMLRRFPLLSGKTTRAVYFLTGVILFTIKYTIDWLVASQVFNREWSPLRYLFWPDRETVQIHRLAPDDQSFALTLLLIALPFILIGVALTIRRIRDAGLPLAFVLFFFIPVVNLTLILLLCLAPSAWTTPPNETPAESNRARAIHHRIAGKSDRAAFLLACLASVIFAVALVVLSANVLQSYGFGVFIFAPFGVGWLSAVLYGIPKRRTLGDCILVSFTSLVLASVVLILFAIEGAICLVMAAPLCIPIALLGGLCGFATQSRPWTAPSLPAMILAVCLSLPALIAAEAFGAKEPSICCVRTEIIVNASPEIVWKYVIAFPPLDEPKDLLFRSGIAYPKRAEIQGTGVGAIRHCIFSTGPFVEPITTWEEPHLLAFDVSSQPAPMEELSPFHIHPPHLDHFLVSHRGQFRLEALPDGRTRLEGTTWYSNRMWPADYWGLYSDAIIGRIHSRVLEHVRTHAEADNNLKRAK